MHEDALKCPETGNVLIDFKTMTDSENVSITYNKIVYLRGGGDLSNENFIGKMTFSGTLDLGKTTKVQDEGLKELFEEGDFKETIEIRKKKTPSFVKELEETIHKQ